LGPPGGESFAFIWFRYWKVAWTFFSPKPAFPQLVIGVPRLGGKFTASDLFLKAPNPTFLNFSPGNRFFLVGIFLLFFWTPHPNFLFWGGFLGGRNPPPPPPVRPDGGLFCISWGWLSSFRVTPLGGNPFFFSFFDLPQRQGPVFFFYPLFLGPGPVQAALFFWNPNPGSPPKSPGFFFPPTGGVVVGSGSCFLCYELSFLATNTFTTSPVAPHRGVEGGLFPHLG